VRARRAAHPECRAESPVRTLLRTVLILVRCKPTAVDPMHGAGMRLFAPRPDGRRQGEPVDGGGGGDGGAFNPAFGKWVDVAVSCETVGLP
jgi:hypothetical protein